MVLSIDADFTPNKPYNNPDLRPFPISATFIAGIVIQ
jgi:hypothetical protein